MREFKRFFSWAGKNLFIQKLSTGRCLKGELEILLSWADPGLKLSTHTATHCPPVRGMEERIG